MLNWRHLLTLQVSNLCNRQELIINILLWGTVQLHAVFIRQLLYHVNQGVLFGRTKLVTITHLILFNYYGISSFS